MTSPQVGEVEPPDGLEARGLRFWRAWTADGHRFSPGHLLLVEEAARAADRLEHLDRILRGEDAEWLSFVADLDGRVVRVVVTSPLSEARQLQVALKQMVGELRQATAAAKPSERPASPSEPQQAKGGPVDRLLRLVADTRNQPSA